MTVTPGHLFRRLDGSFQRIDYILGTDATILREDGTLIQVVAERVVFGADTAHLYEQAERVDYAVSGGAALAPAVTRGWRTYNFEVLEHHTYIAGGIQVHNDSTPTLVVAEAEFYNKFGYAFDGSAESIGKMMSAISNGDIHAYGDYVPLLSDDRYAATAYDWIKDKIVVSMEERGYAASVTRDGIREATWEFDPLTRQVTEVHVGGLTTVLDDGAAGTGGSLTYNGQGRLVSLTDALGRHINLGQVGATLGSQLGNAIAEVFDGNFAVEIASSTLLSTLLGNLGAALGGRDGSALVTALGRDSVTTFSQILDSTFEDLGSQLGENGISQAAAAASAFLAASLAEELGLEGPAAGAFTTTVNTVSQQFVYNIQKGKDLFFGFNEEILGLNIGKALGSYFGSQLAQEIVTPKSEEAALFASATTTVLTALLSAVNPLTIFGTFAATAIGQTLTTMLGNAIFDNDDAATYRLAIDQTTGDLVPVFNSRIDDGKLALAHGMAKMAADHLNTFVRQIGGHIDTESQFSSAILGHFIDSHNNRAAFASGLTSMPSLEGNQAQKEAAIAQAIAAGENYALRSLDVIVKDPVVRRAYYASRDEGLVQLGLDIQVARDYRRYLDNAALINGVMADDPKSAFTAGWAITIARAEELGLDRGSVYDFHNGFYANLKDLEAVQGPRGAAAGFAPERLAWTPELAATDIAAGKMNTGSLILRSEDGTSRVEIEDVFGEGALTYVEGADTNAAVDQREARGSVIFIKAGNGDKTVLGSAERGSIIVGGAGTQTLSGGAGNDWLRAGTGTATLYGRGGDDLLVAGRAASLLDGGEGRNTYYLGTSSTHVQISVLDAAEADTIVTPLAGARDQFNIVEITGRASNNSAAISSQSTFQRSGADLIVTARAGHNETHIVGDETTGSYNVVEFVEDGRKKLVFKNFFLTDSGIDRIEFSNGFLSNAQIWERAGITVRVDTAIWNADDNSRTLSNIDTADTAGDWFSQQRTLTASGETAFVSVINDDDQNSTTAYDMATTAYDVLNRHDWDKWIARYRESGDILSETVTLDGGLVIGSSSAIVAGDIGDDILRGRDTASVLIGDRGNDRLTGGAVNDRLYGGKGDDRYTVNNLGDSVIELTGEGDDTVVTSLSYTLAPGEDIETLQTADPDSQASLDLTGNGFENTLIGNAGANELRGGDNADTLFGGGGDDVLSGGDGNDVMEGGTGDDQFQVHSAEDEAREAVGEGSDTLVAFVTYTLGNAQEIERMVIGSSEEGRNIALTGNNFENTLVGNTGANALTGDAGDDTLDGGGGADTLWGDTGNDTLFGGEGGDTLFGDTGNDTLDGGEGGDTLRGGEGHDSYSVDQTTDSVGEAADAGLDEVRTSLAEYVLTNNVENLSYAGTAAFRGVGNALANTVIGRGGADTLLGEEGNDTLDGLGGDDLLRGGTGSDTYVVNANDDRVDEEGTTGSGYDTLISSASAYVLAAQQYVERLELTAGTAALNLTGNELNNTLVGNNGGNTLDGGDGNDTLEGGLGNDTYIVRQANDAVIEQVGEGANDTIETTLSYALTAGQDIETLRFVDASATISLNLTGNSLANRLVGNAGANVLNGSTGNDTLYGGAGNDSLNGGDGFDVMEGGSGDDNLSGGDGNDVLDGGSGDDQLGVHNTGDIVKEASGEGYDIVVAFLDYTLADGQEIERVVIGSSEEGRNIDLTGNAFDNILVGNAGANILLGEAGEDVLQGQGGDDTLDGGGHHDTLIGGLGNDTFLVNSGGDRVIEADGEGRDTVTTTVSYALAAGLSVEVLRLAAGTEALNLTGNELANTLIGNNGGNTLDGGAGADTLEGSGGNDTYRVDEANDAVIEQAGEGANDIVLTTVGYALDAGEEVETLRFADLSATDDDALTGNGFANTLIGNAGANVLSGGSGNDVLEGNGGDDLFGVHDIGDIVREAQGKGSDTVVTFVSYALADGQEIERMVVGSSVTGAINLTGNDFDNALRGNVGTNILTGNEGNDTLDGGAGSDALRGGTGDDRYSVDSAGDTVNETAGEGSDLVVTFVSYALGAGQEIETLTISPAAGDGDFSLAGNAFGNTLIGNGGENRLLGAAGADTLTGAAGADTFVFNTTLSGSSNVDHLTDFITGVDKIQLSAGIFGTLSPGALAASAFKDTATGAIDADDRILYDRTTGALSYDADGSGAGAAVRFALIDDKGPLGYADFLVA